jgi:hypothetical protein
MFRRWVGKNVDLKLLSEYAGNFFKDKGFKIKIDGSDSEYKIILGFQHALERHENVDIRILGNPNDFVVEFYADRRARSVILLGYVTQLIGGGSLLLRGLKSLEELRKLEKQFWVHIENCVERLTDVH